jgi:hypothetical protein
MNVPGANLLALALSIITPQTVQYYAFTARTTNAAGLRVADFAEAVDIQGSFQPVPRDLYHELGLDLNKNYAMFYSVTLIRDVTRDRTGDQLGFNSKRWQVLSANDWHAVDGWNGVLCVEVPAP